MYSAKDNTTLDEKEVKYAIEVIYKFLDDVLANAVYFNYETSMEDFGIPSTTIYEYRQRKRPVGSMKIDTVNTLANTIWKKEDEQKAQENSK